MVGGTSSSGECRREEPASAAVGEERKVARIVAALDRHLADRIDHVRLRDAHTPAAVSCTFRPSLSATARRQLPPPLVEPIRPPRKRSGSKRPRSKFASVTVGTEPPKPKHAGPGREPALRGPTESAPRSFTHAMLPPPAPIDVMSTVGAMTGRRPTSVREALDQAAGADQADVEARASDVRADHIFELEQPASVCAADDASRRARLERPDGQRRATPDAITPPFDCMTARLP